MAEINSQPIITLTDSMEENIKWEQTEPLNLCLNYDGNVEFISNSDDDDDDDAHDNNDDDDDVIFVKEYSVKDNKQQNCGDRRNPKRKVREKQVKNNYLKDYILDSDDENSFKEMKTNYDVPLSDEWSIKTTKINVKKPRKRRRRNRRFSYCNKKKSLQQKQIIKKIPAANLSSLVLDNFELIKIYLKNVSSNEQLRATVQLVENQIVLLGVINDMEEKQLLQLLK